MIHLSRPAFLDRTITFEDLTNAAELWRLWFTSQAPGGSDFPLDLPTGAFIQLQAELYGFPVFNRDEIEQSATEAFAAAICPVESLSTAARDTLLFASQWLDAKSPASLDSAIALWRAILDSPATKDFCISFIVRCRRGAHDTRLEKGFGGDVLLFTVNRGNGELLLKTIWKPDRSGRLSGLRRATPWPGEKPFLGALTHFTRLRASISAQPIIVGPHWEKLAGEPQSTPAAAARMTYHEFRAIARVPAFMHLSAEKRVGNYISLFYDIPGTRGVATFALRMALSLMLAAVFFALAYQTDSPRNRAFQIILGSLALGAAVRIALVKIRRARRYYKAMNASLGKLYARDSSAEVATFDGFEDDPHPKRFAIEWEALGALHCFDFRLNIGSRHNAVSQLYVLPADNANVTLAYMNTTGPFQQFPSLPLFHLVTRFSDGLNLFTSNSSASGYRKPRNPKHVSRQVRGVFDPAVVLERHRQVTRRLIAEGHKPLPAATTPQVFFDQMRSDHSEMRKLLEGKTIFTWSDALHQTFEMPRKDYFEPGWKRSKADGT